jgi:hypothetical protein
LTNGQRLKEILQQIEVWDKYLLHLDQPDQAYLLQKEEQHYMAKINVYVPEPPQEYTTEGFRQINQALGTIENQLNTSFQQELKNEQDTFNYFMQ